MENSQEEEKGGGQEHDLDDLAQEKPLHIPQLGQKLSPHSIFPEHKKKTSRLRMLPLILLIALGLAVTASIFFLLKGGRLNSNNFTPTPKPKEGSLISTPSPMPTPTPISLDRSRVKLRVLNGSGKTGLAATVSSKLQGLGYTIEKTGNASNSAFERTLVRIKQASSSALYNLLVKDLSYQFQATSGENLKNSDTVDSEIILGLR